MSIKGEKKMNQANWNTKGWIAMHSIGVRFHRVKIILQQKILSEHSWEFAT